MSLQPNDLTLENRWLRVIFDTRSGAIASITHRQHGLVLNLAPANSPPWRIELAGAQWVEGFTTFHATREEKDNSLDFIWENDAGLTVSARVTLPDDSPDACWTIDVAPAAGVTVDKIEFPILRGLGDLGDTSATRLMHPKATGFLFRDPLNLFVAGDERSGLRYAPYPEGFNGAPLQCMAYYRQDVGGFYMAAHDPSGAQKWLNAFKREDGALECSFMHAAPEIAAGKRYAPTYPVLIGALHEGTWYAAAERYKAWATQQRWVAQGPLHARAERSGWLLDKVGLATFGVNAAHDRARWLDWFHATFGTPIFHILGPNWPKHGADYRNNLPGGRDDWFPANVSEANIAALRKNGDRFALFEFDLLLNTQSADGAAIETAHTVLPELRYSRDRYTFPFTCPADDYLPALHCWRDATLAGEYGVDALYYDISTNNVLMACHSPAHNHPVGGGAWMVDAYAAMYRATKSAASAARGNYVPQGAEMVNEVFLPNFDFYQARANASPLACFEGDFCREWTIAGRAEKIPLFDFVYHEYGPVRLDGWAKLSREIGDLFYWVAARVALWGGLLELNYEFSPLETIDGVAEPLDEHYWDLPAHSYEVDPAKVDFVREIAAARTGFAHDFLVYGTMQRSLAFAATEIDQDFLLYNTINREHRVERETMRVPSAIHAAWRAPDGRLGLLFVNLQAEAQKITAQFNAAQYGFAPGKQLAAQRITSTERAPLEQISDGAELTLQLPPRRIVLVEIAS